MPIVAERSEILSFASALWESRDTLYRDEVDGGFYWTFCRPDFRTDLLGTLHEIKAMRKPDESEEEVRARLRRASELIVRWDLENPSLLRDGALTATIPLRGAYFTPSWGPKTGSPSQHTALLLVMSPDWTGQRVEQEIRLRSNETGVDRTKTGAWVLGTSVRVAAMPVGSVLSPLFDLDPFDQLLSSEDTPRLQRPGLLVETSLPLPPEGVIAKVYDQVVVQEGLVEQMGPRGNGQRVAQAIKTWATALLVASGNSGAPEFKDPKGHAIDLVDRALYGDADDLEGEPLSVSTYQRHYNELVKRVPESAAFLAAPKMHRKKRRR